MLNDRIINKCGDDYPQMGACPGELFLELGCLDNPGGEDYRLTRNALWLGYDRADVEGDPELDSGCWRRLAVIMFQCGSEPGQKRTND